MLLDSKKEDFLWHLPHNGGRERNMPWDPINEDLINAVLLPHPPLPGS